MANRTISALRILRAEGYDTLAISGGEPFLYADLPEVTQVARKFGFRISVITNGLLISDQAIRTVRDHVDAVAVSFDGTEAVHNRLRQRKDAFARTVRNLETLRDHEIPFAFSCTASHGNLDDVVSLYELADEHRAVAMQISPVVSVGRAQQADQLALDEDEKTRLFLMARALDSTPDGPRVRVELQPQAEFQRSRRQFGLLSDTSQDRPLSDLVNPLVISERGVLSPFAYGMARRYDIGTIYENVEEAIRNWRSDGIRMLRELVARSFEDPTVQKQDFVEWYADMVYLSQL